MIALRNLNTRKQAWLAAATGEQVDDRTARFSGSRQMGGVTFRFETDVALKPAMPAAASLRPLASLIAACAARYG